jgi:hypothetical protein
VRLELELGGIKAVMKKERKREKEKRRDDRYIPPFTSSSP